MQVVKSDNDLLSDAAVEAARQFVFTPAYMNNGPVSVWIGLPVTFRLQDHQREKKRESQRKVLTQKMHDHTIAQFGFEPCRLWWHDLSRIGNREKLFNRSWIKRKCHGHLSGVDPFLQLT